MNKKNQTCTGQRQACIKMRPDIFSTFIHLWMSDDALLPWYHKPSKNSPIFDPQYTYCVDKDTFSYRLQQSLLKWWSVVQMLLRWRKNVRTQQFGVLWNIDVLHKGKIDVFFKINCTFSIYVVGKVSFEELSPLRQCSGVYNAAKTRE